jgi:peptidoglycan/LPS O-acetylase OafA/YrhL
VLAGVCIPLAVYLPGSLSADRYPTNGMIVLARVMPLFMAGMGLQRLRMMYSSLSNVIAYTALAFVLCAFSIPQLAPFAVLAIPLLILSSISAPVLSRVFSNQALVWLGTVSYSLYMTHALVEMFFVNAALRWSARYFAIDLAQSAMASAALLLASVGIALIVGWFTWRWIEVPGRAVVTRLMMRSTYLVPLKAVAS